ncbi:MAG: M48 family metallopeptidase [Kiritimatiellaeota bacterium]|nr:M48 family metallopeptidase [Kiritimatiellota bacterium]
MKIRNPKSEIRMMTSGLALAMLGLLAGCSTIAQLGTAVGQATGTLTPEQAASINRSAAAMEKTFQDITPEQEYYIGRSVAATILTTYQPLKQAATTEYLNVLGQTLAMYSDKPETFGGYHFAIMDTDEINAFAAPGGLIMVSRGLLRCCRNEDALAAVLAHEIGHVEKQHGLKAISKGRLTSALTILAVEAGKNLGGQNLAQVTKAFEGSIGDITGTLINTGYTRQLEFQADAAAVVILRRVGYNPEGLVNMLDQMQQTMKPGSHGFGTTHPSPQDRIAALRKTLSAPAAVTAPPARQARFTQAAGKI